MRHTLAATTVARRAVTVRASEHKIDPKRRKRRGVEGELDERDLGFSVDSFIGKGGTDGRHARQGTAMAVDGCHACAQ